MRRPFGRFRTVRLAAVLCAVLALGAAAPPASAQSGAPASAMPSPDEALALPSVVTVAVLDDAPPFSFMTPYGFRAGFDFELARALCGRLPLQCTFVTMPADQVASRLAGRQADVAVASLSITPELDEVVDFTRPYLEPGARFVVPRGTPVVPEAPAVVGAVRGTPHATFLERTAESPARVWLYNDAEAMWLDLGLGRIDAVLTTPVLARRAFLSTPAGRDFTFAPGIVRDRESYGAGSGIAVREGEDTLRALFDGALAAFMETEAYAGLRERYFGRDAYGNGAPPPAAPLR